MTVEQPTKCPVCERMSCYDYNGTPVCQDCYHRQCQIQAIRDYMLRITFRAKQEDHQPEADVLNKLVPIIVSQITDDEIEEALKQKETE